MSIARCTSAHPIIRQIRQACAEPFEAFEECLRQNEAAMGNCTEHVRRFLQCAERVQLPHSPTPVEILKSAVTKAPLTISNCCLALLLVIVEHVPPGPEPVSFWLASLMAQ
ncbi:Coiled-coil-helix-coiled-coil-helix domain-containing protein 5 [Fukomys damarensis]|uniref:Coiled-coil-helix-coiled-coil-helix domain-containing protein 5 n=1 Tax=Fukomys damarensis TaxID=885580 RepID=A0A091D8E2_FUKDA|nr:Coiled-coil-helix-coiled-coil-helix domain-containing protein 5 [Fukomys damarensis]